MKQQLISIFSLVYILANIFVGGSANDELANSKVGDRQRKINFTVEEVKDSPLGSILFERYFYHLRYLYKLELFKNGQKYYTRTNNSAKINVEFKKLDNIVHVADGFDNGTYNLQYYIVHVDRYSLGEHLYSNNISGFYEFAAYESNSTLPFRSGDHINSKHVQLELAGYKKNKVDINKDEQIIEFDCKFDLYENHLTSLNFYLNNSTIFEYKLNHPTTSAFNLTEHSYDINEWLLNDRSTISFNDNSMSLVITDIDTDLNGKYYCRIEYVDYLTGLSGTLNSNLVYLNVI